MTFGRFGLRFVVTACVVLGVARPAAAFSHIVKPGETLSQIAARVYGDARKETILAGANALDVQGGSAIVPGMRLEIPSPAHHTVIAGDTWNALALTWLGDSKRSDVLARLNGAVAWVDPPVGLAVEIPAVIAHIAADGDTSGSIAARYWGDSNRGWELNAFNGRREAPFQRGEIVLVYLPGVALSDSGKAEAALASQHVETETDTTRLDIQRRADAELPLLLEDVRQGRYAAAVARANRVIVSGPLTKPQLAALYRALIDAYVALPADAEATAACANWRANEPNAHLDPVLVSPKVRAACAR